jgi:hypothetical protein
MIVIVSGGDGGFWCVFFVVVVVGGGGGGNGGIGNVVVSLQRMYGFSLWVTIRVIWVTSGGLRVTVGLRTGWVRVEILFGQRLNQKRVPFPRGALKKRNGKTVDLIVNKALRVTFT